MRFRRNYSNEVDRTTGIIYDPIGKLVKEMAEIMNTLFQSALSLSNFFSDN